MSFLKNPSLLSFRPRVSATNCHLRDPHPALLALSPCLAGESLWGQGMGPPSILWVWVLVATMSTGQRPGRKSQSMGWGRERGTESFLPGPSLAKSLPGIAAPQKALLLFPGVCCWHCSCSPPPHQLWGLAAADYLRELLYLREL